jgi:uncharacterized membrane protein YgcG
MASVLVVTASADDHDHDHDHDHESEYASSRCNSSVYDGDPGSPMEDEDEDEDTEEPPRHVGEKSKAFHAPSSSAVSDFISQQAEALVTARKETLFAMERAERAEASLLILGFAPTADAALFSRGFSRMAEDSQQASQARVKGKGLWSKPEEQALQQAMLETTGRLVWSSIMSRMVQLLEDKNIAHVERSVKHAQDKWQSLKRKQAGGGGGGGGGSSSDGDGDGGGSDGDGVGSGDGGGDVLLNTV